MPTGNYRFPFPTLSDVPNVPADTQALAEAVDTQLHRVEQFVQSGRVQFLATTVPGGGAATQAVVFPFPFSVLPEVFVSTIGNPGGTNTLITRTSGITYTGFNIRLTNTSSTGATFSSNWELGWLAIGWLRNP